MIVAYERLSLVRTSATIPPVPEQTTHVTIGMSQTAVMVERSVFFSDNILYYVLSAHILRAGRMISVVAVDIQQKWQRQCT